MNVHQKQEKNLLSTMTYQWLQAQLLVKLSRWAGEDNLRTETTSLRTVSVDAYNRLYNELKAKYGPDLIRVSYFVSSKNIKISSIFLI